MTHPVYQLGEEEPNIYKRWGGTVLAEIDEDDEDGTPVFAVVNDKGSYVVFVFPDDDDAMHVLFAKSVQYGDLERLVGKAVGHFGKNEVVVFQVINDRLPDRMEDFEEETHEVDNEEVKAIRGQW